MRTRTENAKKNHFHIPLRTDKNICRLMIILPKFIGQHCAAAFTNLNVGEIVREKKAVQMRWNDSRFIEIVAACVVYPKYSYQKINIILPKIYSLNLTKPYRTEPKMNPQCLVGFHVRFELFFSLCLSLLFAGLYCLMYFV